MKPTILFIVRRGELVREEKLLLIWMLVLLLVYSVPSQRGGRYLLPAMPAVAVMLALWWQRIPRGLFIVSSGLAGLLMLLLGLLSLRVAAYPAEVSVYPWYHWATVALGLALAVVDEEMDSGCWSNSSVLE